jgi:hypothetical protein
MNQLHEALQKAADSLANAGKNSRIRADAGTGGGWGWRGGRDINQFH